MSYTPTPERACDMYSWAHAWRTEDAEGETDLSLERARQRAQFERMLAQVRAEAAAEALERFATYLDGGTPRAWGFHHPCDPPGKRWEPDDAERALMTAADAARERTGWLRINADADADKETP